MGSELSLNSPSLNSGKYSINHRSSTVRRFSNFPSRDTENLSSPTLRSKKSLNLSNRNVDKLMASSDYNKSGLKRFAEDKLSITPKIRSIRSKTNNLKKINKIAKKTNDILHIDKDQVKKKYPEADMVTEFYDKVNLGGSLSKKRGGGLFEKNPSMKQHSQNKMICSPYADDNKVISKSCYTSDVLDKLKKYYNDKNPKDPIKETEHAELWKILKSKLVECHSKKEDCWLSLIDDEKLKAEIDKDIFAPDTPPEWTIYPHEWLSNYDISKVLKQYEKIYPNFKFIEPSPIDFDKTPYNYNGKCVSDELCNFNLKKYIKNGITKIGFVFNLDEHTEGGSHWVSMFLDIEDEFIFYFNSTGEKIPDEIEKLKDRIIEQAKKIGIELIFIQNHPTSHQRGNTECGMYSLYFIIKLLTSEDKKKEKINLNKKIDSYDYEKDSYTINDKKHLTYKTKRIEELSKIRKFKDPHKIISDDDVFKLRQEYFNFPYPEK
jgi:hypothetical protein